LDYEETLQSFINIDNENKDKINIDSDDYIMKKHSPSKKVIQILKKLCKNEKNYVYIITGKKKIFLEEWFKSIDNLGCGAEYGYSYKFAQESSESWGEKEYKDSMKENWKTHARNIMEQFEAKTEGSLIKEKNSSISWDFGNCDYYSGIIQAIDLGLHLSYAYNNSPNLEIVTGKSYVEIKPKDLNKGFFISFVLKHFYEKTGRKPDFIFACGDDVSDEEMFKYLNYINKIVNVKQEDVKIITSTIDKKPSKAQFYIHRPKDLLEILENLN
jgi:trehalose 6-phosphate synthase/phosphatase